MPVVHYNPKPTINARGRDCIGQIMDQLERNPILPYSKTLELLKQAEIFRLLEEARKTFPNASEAQIIEHLAAKHDYLADLTEKSLQQRLRVAERARQSLVKTNMRWVVKIAKKYMNRGLPFEELIQEGATGLSRAGEKFDINKGFRFSTYSCWWIKQAMTRAIANTSRTIRLPIHLVESWGKVRKASAQFKIEKRRDPSVTELAEFMGKPVEELNKLFSFNYRTCSLNKKVGASSDCEDTELGDLAAVALNQQIPEDAVHLMMLSESIQSNLAKLLSPSEQQIIEMRFGLTSGDAMTLQEVATVLGLSRERVRQLQVKAVAKLRVSREFKKFREVLCA